MTTNRTLSARALALAMAGALVLAACGSDASSTTSSTAPAGTAAVSDTTAAGSDTTAASGSGTIGYIVAGDRNDGGFYQGQVEAVEAAAQKQGFKVIVVDKVNPGAAREAFDNLARQSPDLIIAGGAELSDGMIPVSEAPEYSGITFILVTGAPPSTKSYSTVGADENQAHYMGGVAAGEYLKSIGGNTACIVAGPELPFVQNMDKSMKAGLKRVDPSFQMLVTYTGDFEDAALAQEAATAQMKQNCELVYPYLGGALSAVLSAGKDAGIGLTSTSVDRCKDPTMKFATSILYNPALYLSSVIESFKSGKVVKGEQLALYGVGDGVDVGATVCGATAEQQAALDAAAADLISGAVTPASWLG